MYGSGRLHTAPQGSVPAPYGMGYGIVCSIVAQANSRTKFEQLVHDRKSRARLVLVAETFAKRVQDDELMQNRMRGGVHTTSGHRSEVERGIDARGLVDALEVGSDGWD